MRGCSYQCVLCYLALGRFPAEGPARLRAAKDRGIKRSKLAGFELTGGTRKVIFLHQSHNLYFSVPAGARLFSPTIHPDTEIRFPYSCPDYQASF